MDSPTYFAHPKESAPHCPVPPSPARTQAARRRRSLLLKPKPIKKAVVESARVAAKRWKVVRVPTPTSPRVHTTTIASASDKPSRIPNTVASTHVLARKQSERLFGGPTRNCQIALERPETLKRPTVSFPANIDALACAGYAPDLRIKGLEQLTQDIIKDGQSLFDASSATTVPPMSADKNNHLPPSCNISVPYSVPIIHAPTHMVAVYEHAPETTPDEECESDSSTTEPPCPKSVKRVTVFPIHSQVLAVSCPRLPPLPYSLPMPTNLGASSYKPRSYGAPKEFNIPIVPMGIPSPETFGMLIHALYTRSFTTFLTILLPETKFTAHIFSAHDDPDDAECYDPAELADTIASYWTSESIMCAFLRVYGVYRNVCSLGVTDENVWLAIDIAWKAYRDALLLCRK